MYTTTVTIDDLAEAGYKPAKTGGKRKDGEVDFRVDETTPFGAVEPMTRITVYHRNGSITPYVIPYEENLPVEKLYPYAAAELGYARKRAGKGEKVYLDVPYRDKDRAKALGARWMPYNKKWYITTDMDPGRFAEWLPSGGGGGSRPPARTAAAEIARSQTR